MVNNLITLKGVIEFEPKNLTPKHEKQSDWKIIALINFDGDISEYYSWFLKKRFNLILNKPIRKSHITFINDRFEEITGDTNEEKSFFWDKVKNKWNGKLIDVTLNLDYFTNGKDWWLNVDHAYRDEIQGIRNELGLERPHSGLHLTVGRANDWFIDTEENKGKFCHSRYLLELNKKGIIKLNEY